MQSVEYWPFDEMEPFEEDKEDGREDREPECNCYCVGDQADASECRLHRG